MRKHPFAIPIHRMLAGMVVLLLCTTLLADSTAWEQPHARPVPAAGPGLASPASTIDDENRVLTPDRVPGFLERTAYRNDASIADLLEESHLRLVDGTTGIWLQRSEHGVSVLALSVEPIDNDMQTRTLLLIVSAGGSDYPILTDAPLGNGTLRMQILGTNEAIAVHATGPGGYEVRPTAAFDPMARAESANALRRVRADGLGETLSCLVGALFSNFTWSEIVCATADYAICVAGSGGAGLASCAIAFKQLLSDCSSELPVLAQCFGIAADSSDPGISIGQPANGATVRGTTPITATVSDNTLKAVTVQVDYLSSSGRRVALVADAASIGGCSLSSTSATCATQFNFGLAANGSSASIKVTATDMAGNVGRASRNVTVSNGPVTYSISGNAGQSGVGISGCTQSTQTDANGNYQLNGCVAGTQVITPSRSGCTFTPASRTITVGPNASGVNFTPSCGGTVVTLANGQTVTSLSASSGTWKYYRISVPNGQFHLKVTMSGGTGDADLYVRRGAMPTATLWDYRSYQGGNNESVTVTSPLSGDWYIGVRAYSSYSGLSLVATYSGATCTTTSGSLAGTGYAVYVPSSSGYTSSASGVHSGRLTGTGIDFDLYLQKYMNSVWTTVAQSAASGSTETVNYSGTSGTYRWRVHSYSGSGSFSLCASRP